MIVLKRKLQTQTWQAIVEVGIETQQDLFRSVALLIKSTRNPRRNEVERKIAVELLNRPKQPELGQRLLKRFEDMQGVVIHDFSTFVELTESGKKLADSGTLFIPQSDVYSLTFTEEDPLLPYPLVVDLSPIKIEMDSNLFAVIQKLRQGRRKDEEWSKRKKRENNLVAEKITKLPLIIQKVIDKEHHLLNNDLVKVYNIEAYGTKLDKRLSLQLQLEILRKENKLVVRGTNNQALPTFYSHNFTLDYSEVLNMLLEQEGFRLDQNSKCVVDKERFQKLSSEEKDTFQGDVKIKSPTLPPYGSFNSLSLSISYVPADDVVAKLWAYYLCIQRINTYLTEKRYENLWKSVISSRELKKYDCGQKIPWDFLESELDLKFPTYWYTQAPKDLNMDVFK